jgi:metal-responsive CopG/Arc/MetJ family transcriptional regulator
MVARASRLNLRVSDDLLVTLEEIGARKGLKTVSDVARDALSRYSDEEADTWNSEIVKTKIPRGTMEALETLIMAGDATDVPQAINFALNDWVASKTKYHLEGRDALKKKVEEVIEERAAKERLKSVAKEMSKR